MEDKIIEFVRSNRIIYDKTHPEYKNSTAKEKKWSSLAEEINTPVDILKKRWKTLRDGFFQHLKKEKNPPSGSEQRSPEEEKYKYFNQLRFLANCESVNQRTTGNFQERDSVEDSSIEGLIEESFEVDEPDIKESMHRLEHNTTESSSSSSRISTPIEDSSSTQQPPSKRRRRLREELIEQNAKGMLDIIKSFKEKFIQKPSAEKAFMDSIAMQVERANLNQKRFASFQIKVITALQEEIAQQKKDTPSTSSLE